MRNLMFLALLYLLSIPTYAQLVKQASFCRYEPSQVVNPESGITIYDNLNAQLGGKSARYDADNNPIQGWVEDYYENGKVLHRGYYINGQLKTYKNYYSNGNIERLFMARQWRRSKLKTYYQDGQTRMKVAFFKNKERKLESYYQNGNQKEFELKNRFAQYYVLTKSFYEDGKVKTVFELTDKVNFKYNKTVYHQNGTIKEHGIMTYDVENNRYLKQGTWKEFDTAGNIVAQKNYINGKTDGEKLSW